MAKQLSVEIYPTAIPFSQSEITNIFAEADVALLNSLAHTIQTIPVSSMHSVVVRNGEMPLLLIPLCERRKEGNGVVSSFQVRREISLGFAEPEIPTLFQAKELSMKTKDEALALAEEALESFAQGLRARLRGRLPNQSLHAGE